MRYGLPVVTLHDNGRILTHGSVSSLSFYILKSQPGDVKRGVKKDDNDAFISSVRTGMRIFVQSGCVV